MKKTADTVVVGAGVIGLTTALRLSQQGVQVILVDRQNTGREASWAGAGMLPPGNLEFAKTPEARLRSYSHQLWDDLANELYGLTGIDTGYSRCGAIELNAADNPSQLSDLRCQLQAEHILFDELAESELRRFAPEIGHSFHEAISVPNFGQVRNPRHMKALESACLQQGVHILRNDHVRLHRNESGLVSVESTNVKILAETVCVAAGAWSNDLLKAVGCQIPVQPVRGQIVQLKPDELTFRHVIQIGRRYLVPRKDGLVLVGSTEDHCGFSKKVTSEGIRELLAFAEDLVPSLATAEVVRQWAGLRPGSPDELPFLGSVSNCKNLFVACGHFRSGLQMSIGTAEIMCRLMTGKPSEINLDGLDADRLVNEACCSQP